MSSTSPRINSKDNSTPGMSRWESILLGFSALFIFFAWDDNFNMQVMAPVTILFLIGYVIKTKGRFSNAGMLGLCLLILGSCSVSLLSCLLLNHEAISLKSLVRFFYVASILVFIFVIVDRKYTNIDLNIIVLGNIVAGAIIGLGIIGRYLNGASGKIAVTNIWGIPVEENYMASLMAFEFTIAIIALRYTKGFKQKLGISILALINILGIILSGSRAAMLGALAGAALFLLFYLSTGSAGGFVMRLLVLIALILGALVLVANVSESVPSWYFDRFFHNSYLDSSNMQRIRFWLFGLEGFMARPLFGYGVGNYAYYVSAEKWSEVSDVVVAHNTYIDALVDIGLVGTVLFAILILMNFKGAWKNGAFLSLLFVGLWTSFIVGGERTFFFWNSVVLLSIFARYASGQNSIDTGIASIFNLSNLKRDKGENGSRY